MEKFGIKDLQRIGLEIFFKDIKSIINSFLKRHGGCKFGYNTYVRGRINLNNSGNCFSWKTPKSITNYSEDEVLRYGSLLVKRIIRVMKNHGIPSIEFSTGVDDDNSYRFSLYCTVMFRQRIDGKLG